jgi:hypothetical protein
MSVSRTGRRALHLTVTAAVSVATVLTLQGTGNAAPSASGVASPLEGKLTAGTIITVSGSGFKDAVTGANLVKAQGAGVGAVINGTTCTDAAAAAGTALGSFSVASATKIAVKLPAHAAGAVKVCLPVVSTAGTHTANTYVTAGFTYAAQPVFGAASTSSGPSYGGQTVTLTASPAWRASSTSVTVGGVAASNVKVAAGGASLSFTTPAGTGSALDIVVKTPGFANVTATGAYTYDSAIQVTPHVVDPAGDSIDISGAGFSGLTSAGVWFQDGATDPACANVVVVSDSEIVCDLPAHAAAAGTVVVGEDVDGTLANATSKSVVTSGSTVTFASY